MSNGLASSLGGAAAEPLDDGSPSGVGEGVEGAVEAGGLLGHLPPYMARSIACP